MPLLRPPHYPFLIVALGIIAYGNAPFGEYSCDDPRVIVECSAIESLSGLPLLASTNYSSAFGELSYRPVVSLSYFADGLLFGKRAFASKAFNIAIHIAAALGLFGLWRRLFERERLAALAAAIFVCHPLASEVVNSPGFREDALATLLMVCALRLLVESVLVSGERAALGLGAVSAIVWWLALLSKESAVMLVAFAPLLLLASDRTRRRVWPLPRGRWARYGAVKALFLLAFALYVGLYLHFRHDTGQPAAWPGGAGPLLGFLNFCRTFLLYARLWLAPAGLSVAHFFEPSASLADWRLWSGAAAFSGMMLVAAAMLIRGRDATRIAGAGGAWAGLALLPVAQIVPTPELVAERYVYMAHAGVGLLAASALLAGSAVSPAVASAAGRHTPRFSVRHAAILVLLFAFTGATLARNRAWTDAVTLDIARYALWDNAEGHTALAALYHAQGRKPRAETEARQALALDPDHADAHRILGVLLHESGRLDEARKHLEKAWELEPDNELNRQALENLKRGLRLPRP